MQVPLKRTGSFVPNGLRSYKTLYGPLDDDRPAKLEIPLFSQTDILPKPYRIEDPSYQDNIPLSQRKMSLLAAATTQTASDMSYQQESELVGKYPIELSPALKQFSEAVRPAFLAFADQFSRLSHAILTHLVFGCSVAALQTYLVAKDLTTMSASALGEITWTAWNSSQVRRLRKKLEFEFFVLILGCGNSLCLAVFWPGWFVIGLLYLAWTVLRFLVG